MTQIAAPVTECPKCKGRLVKYDPPPSLDLVWAATFTDGIVKQFDNPDNQETGEHLFKEVLDRKDALTSFSLLNLRTNRVYDVDLLNGRINIYTSGDGDSNMEPEVSGSAKYRYRLIYFRRVTRQMTWNGKQVGDKGVQDIQYFLGFQYTNEDGKNVKRLLQISKDDEVHLA